MSLGLLVLLVLAVSIDGFSAGLSFGLRKVVIPLQSLLIICLLSSLMAASSILIGGRLARLIPASWLSLAGGILLIGLGLFIALQGLRPERPTEETVPSGGLPLLASISRCPDRADLDRSGELNAREAFFLGLVLAADVFAAGLGASLIGLPILLMALAVGGAKFILIPLGVECGRLVSRLVPVGWTSLLAGSILTFIGVFNIF
ncbi:MAG: sporulation membrane protein YtaF [Firmicutes bacterium]|nr:sporulation membrane protein YtaF [Bacillota bacterium]